ncbi:prealbumin-like fold domain-containing protein [uncultured Leifsonia sp.]|uniref:prealbumin-like fold domain-containing protein n=1 Tax=uncultured Leifsonia sp. TaxID=340359 RepID=UPI0028D1FF39|nr:prealbumin-like fold domain-containing protein [uncultured Leifsonia sp.]
MTAGLVAVILAQAPVLQAPEPANAAVPEVNLGSMRARLDPNAVRTTNASGAVVNNCLYTRTDGPWVSSANWSVQAHGTPVSLGPNEVCAGNIGQSRIHLTPGAGVRTALGAPFVVAAMSHRNNPTYSSVTSGSAFLSGTAQLKVPGVNAEFEIDWKLQETQDNLMGPACPTDPTNTGKCPDELTFPAGVEQSFMVGPVPYLFRVVHSQIVSTGPLTGGYDNGGAPGPPDYGVAEGVACPAAPTGRGILSSVTREDRVTKICIYAEIAQDRTLKVTKNTTSPAGGLTFPFTSSSDRADSPWATQSSFSLGAGLSRGPQTAQAGETVTIQEGTPPGDWELEDISCVDGVGAAVADVEYDVVARSVVLREIPIAQSVTELPITCTFTNALAPQGRWTLAKTAAIDGVPGGDEAMPGDTIAYRVTATGIEGTVTGATITDDLANVLTHAAFQSATLQVNGGGASAVPLVGTTLTAGPFALGAGQTAVLEYRVIVDDDAWLSALHNVARAVGSVAPDRCAAGDPPAAECQTSHRTPSRFLVQKLGYGINGEEPFPVAVDGALFDVRADDNGAPGAPIDAQPVATGAVGRFDVAGIWPGTYWLTELKAPTGHALLAEPVRFTVAADGTLTVHGDHPNVEVDGSGFELGVVDTAAYVLPETGGPGTWLFVAGGLATLATALLAAILRRRRT